MVLDKEPEATAALQQRRPDSDDAQDAFTVRISSFPVRVRVEPMPAVAIRRAAQLWYTFFMGGDFTSFGLGPVIFYPITAIFSVAMLTLAITLSIRGIVVAPDKKATYIVLLTIASLFALFFFYAVINYQWLGGETAYDGLYHSIGYVGSIVIALITTTIAASDKVTTKRIVLWSIATPYLFLIVNSAVATSFTAIVSTFSGPVESTAVSRIIGFLYASIQIVFPLVYLLYIQNPGHKEAAMRARSTKLGTHVEPGEPSQPTPPVVAPTAPQPDNATQDTLNRQ